MTSYVIVNRLVPVVVCSFLRFEEKISNFIQNYSTWLTVDIHSCRNNLHNDNGIIFSQDASWSYSLWLGLTTFFQGVYTSL
jgi:hypothetical protein